MGYSKETPNYHLPQYIAEDRPSYLGDWNEAMSEIDSGMNDNKNNIITQGNNIAVLTTRLEGAENDIDSLGNDIVSFGNDVKAVEAKFPIGSADILEEAVTSDKIADGSVTSAKLAAESVTSASLSPAATGSNKFFGKRVLWIGDSWFDSSYDSKGANAPHHLTDQLKCISTYETRGSRGYIQTSDWGPKTFVQSLEDHAGEEFEYVICYGSINDQGYDYVSLRSAVSSFVNRSRVLFPNAECIIIPPFGNTNFNMPSSVSGKWMTVWSGVHDGAHMAEATVIELTLTAFLGYPDSVMDGNLLHPADGLGVDLFCTMLKKGLLTGSVPYVKYGAQSTYNVKRDLGVSVDTVNGTVSDATCYMDQTGLVHFTGYWTGTPSSTVTVCTLTPQRLNLNPFTVTKMPNQGSGVLSSSYNASTNKVQLFASGSGTDVYFDFTPVMLNTIL